MGRKSKAVLQTERQLIKDDIVAAASKLVKDHDAPIVRGMTEIGYRWIKAPG